MSLSDKLAEGLMSPRDGSTPAPEKKPEAKKAAPAAKKEERTVMPGTAADAKHPAVKRGIPFTHKGTLTKWSAR